MSAVLLDPVVDAARESPRALLSTIGDPAALRRLAPAQLPGLATELRQHLVTSVAASGGHLAAGLGVVELTIALHYAFDTPRDSLVWDVGHQAYPHKILTGRREQIATVRQRGGLSAFLRPEESEYDAFGAGHSSTSISAALGIAIANAQQGRGHRAVAIIGDGGMTAGLAHEALDHAGALGVDLLVVLNDNGMSISPNVGALSRYLARQPVGADDATRSRHLTDVAELDGRAAGRPGQLFEELGFAYTGPVDGHDLPGLVRVLMRLRRARGPRLLHVVTNKGHGFAPAVLDPVKYHGVTPFDPTQGIVSGAASQPTYTQLFGDWLCASAARDPRVVAITPAMREGSGLVEFARRFPERYHDVGIAEQHSVTFAAGLASQGLRPVVAIYSTFLQRAYDQLIHDVAIQNLPVLFAIDRAGVVGPDGATHNGSFDLSFLRCVPGLVVMTPADGPELNAMLELGLAHPGAVAIRYPRCAAQPAPPRDVEPAPLRIGIAETRRHGQRVALLVFGTLLPAALAVAARLDATVINMRYVKPLDRDAVLAAARTHELLVTIEENAVAGGAGSAVGELLASEAVQVGLMQLGLPDRFPEHGTRAEVLSDVGLDEASILAAIEGRLARMA